MSQQEQPQPPAGDDRAGDTDAPDRGDGSARPQPDRSGPDAGPAGRPTAGTTAGPSAGPSAGSGAAVVTAPPGAAPRPPKRTGVFVEPDALREHVGGLLRAMLGGYEVDAFGNFTFTHDDARVFVTIGPSPIGPHVGVFSVTNVGVELTPQLGEFLLTTNHRLGFGSFSYDPDNRAVWLRHTLLGTTLDGPELQSAVAAVASTAAHFDDVVRDRFGGQALRDAPADVRARTRPPETATQPPNAGGYL